MGKRRVVASVAVAAFLGAAGPASAEVRSGSVTDPLDQPTPATGKAPLDADRLSVRYDSEAGELRVALHFVPDSVADEQDWPGDGRLRLSIGSQDQGSCRGAVDLDLSVGLDQYEGRLSPGDVWIPGDLDLATRERVYTVRHASLEDRDFSCVGQVSFTSQVLRPGGEDSYVDNLAGFALASGGATPGPSTGTTSNQTSPSSPPPATVPGPPIVAASAPAAARRARLVVRATIRGRRAVARVRCPSSGTGVLTLRSRHGSVRRSFRCRAGRTVVVRAQIPGSARRVRLRVSVGEQRVAQTVRLR